MPDLGALTFLPYLRRGLAVELTDASGSEPAHAAVSVRVNAHTSNVSVPVLGPEDVLGFDPRVISRTSPRADVFDGEPNYLPHVEFRDADLPWRFSPTAGDVGRVKPWIVLVALADDEIDAWIAPSQDRRLGVVRVVARTPLPDLDDSWAWAHTQFAGVLSSSDSETLTRTANAQPRSFVSRLLCPRRLKPRTSYTAFVVPAFARGRLAGLGASVDRSAVGPLAPSWSGREAPSAPAGGTLLELPVYFQWRFGTGVAGDFEALIREIEPRRLGADVGARPFLLPRMDSGVVPAAPPPLLFQSALVPVSTPVAPYVPTAHAAFDEHLRTSVNAPVALASGDDTDPIVSPPLYGGHHTHRLGLGTPRPGPPWLDDLNVDPRCRVAAGLGADVVIKLQEELMEETWNQYDGIRRANEERALQQMGRALSDRIYEQNVRGAGLDVLLGAFGAASSQMRGSPTTVSDDLAQSPVCAGALTPTFRRLARRGGPAGRRQSKQCETFAHDDLVVDMNSGRLAAPDLAGCNASVPTPSRVLGCTCDAKADDAPAPSSMTFSAQVQTLLGALAGGDIGSIAQASARSARVSALPDLDLVAEIANAAQPPSRGGGVAERFDVPWADNLAQGSAVGDATFAIETFRSAAVTLFAAFDEPLATPQAPTPANLEAVRAAVLSGLEPFAAFAAAQAARLGPLDASMWTAADPIAPIMAGPEFDRPMYAPLRDLSQDWIMSGLDRVPPKTVALLKTNWRFVEAYMVGLSYELGRELLWREFPTDLRGTYFRQFWDRTATRRANPSTPREALLDIAPIHTWLSAPLGTARWNREAPADARGGAPAENLVLLLRSDLLRRFPNTQVFALAMPGTEAPDPRSERAMIRHPIFTGTLPPDITFLGFDMALENLLHVGGPGSAAQTWYFVFQEPIGAPRFGLDEPRPGATRPPPDDRRRSDLNWHDVWVGGGRRVEPGAHIVDPAGQVSFRQAWENVAEGVRWPDSPTAAHVAYLTCQQPVMYIVPARTFVGGLRSVEAVAEAADLVGRVASDAGVERMGTRGGAGAGEAEAEATGGADRVVGAGTMGGGA